MSCPYYWYNHHYACRKSGKDVNEDIYDKYCKNYDYDDCPIYKGESSSGGCFLTSACVEARGLPNDCHELTVLRAFRDNYLKAQPGGLMEVAEYYAVAPKVVAAMEASPERKDLFDGLYRRLVEPCVRMIEEGRNEEAHVLYRSTMRELQAQYL